MKTFNKISMTGLVVVAMVATNVMADNVINEGTFDTEAGLYACWATNGQANSGWTDAANVSPISGGYVWFNSAQRTYQQTFDGITLQPNYIYRISFDAITLAGANDIIMGLFYMTGSSNTSAVSGYLAEDDILNFSNDSTWSASGDANQHAGGDFTCPLAPGADDPLSSHFFQFNTPAVLNGPASAFGLYFKNSAGVQSRLDNIVVDVTAIPEPATLGLLSLLGLALLRRK